MSINPYVGAYWGPRAESLNACVDRSTTFLDGLRLLNPAFETWYLPGRSRRDALRRRVHPEREALLNLLGSGRNRRDSDQSVIAELGYSMDLWNGQAPSVGLSVGCGMHPRTPHVKNVAVVNLPSSDDGLGDLASTPVALGLMRLLVDCWEPDWATWTSHEWRKEQGGEPGAPVLGWMTYLAGALPAEGMPAGVIVEPFGSGALITTADDIAGVTRDVLVAAREALGGQLRST